MMAYDSLGEQELATLLKSGNERAFAEIYERYSQRIYSNLRKLLKDDQLAQELLQDTFVKIWEKREQLTFEISFRSYLYKISDNLVRDFFRKVSRDKKLIDHLILVASSNGNSIEYSDNFEVDQELMTRAIEQLPPQRRRVFTMCKLEGRSYDEVSALLGISNSTINDHIVKATKAIRIYISSPGNAAMLLLTAALITGFDPK